MKKVGFGTRVLNFLIDTSLIFDMAYGISAWWDFQAMYWGYPYLPFYVILAIVVFIYYMFFEMIFKRSPGKWFSKSKVVNNNGKKPASWQILIRSLIRLTVIDCFFIPWLDKPLHDYLSKTEVVEM